MERLTGDTIDISKWMESEFYDLCWYWDNQNDNTEGKIGRWIGVSHRVVSSLFYCVLTEKGKINAFTTLQHVTQDEAKKPEIQ